jgi:hypothetical protein
VGDPAVAQALLSKVNAMNASSAFQSLLGAFAFAALPRSMSAPLAFFLGVFAILYALREVLVLPPPPPCTGSSASSSSSWDS